MDIEGLRMANMYRMKTFQSNLGKKSRASLQETTLTEANVRGVNMRFV